MGAALKIAEEYLPTLKLERFKYTNIPVYLKKKELVSGVSNTEVQGNTEFVSELSACADVLWVQEVIKYEPAGAKQYADMMLWDLANSVVADGHVVDVPKNTQSNVPLNLGFKGETGRATNTRQIIRIGTNSELTIVETHTGDGVYWNNSVTQIKVEKGARLKHYRLQENGVESLYTQNTHIQIEEGGSYEAFTLTTGGKTSRNQVHVEMLGERAEVFLNGINLLSGKQLGDTTITVEHKAPNCMSKQNYRSVIDGSATGVFQGKVHVHQIAQKTDGYQFAKALLLSPQATMNTKPELEIYADDVKCSHGATTGQLDDEALFYMCSRGIHEGEAKTLLIEAFIAELFEEISNEDMREKVSFLVSGWLKNHE